MSYANSKGVITAKKGKAEDAPSVSIQDPLYQEGANLNYWVDAYGEEVVKEVFLQARQVIIQRVGRGILNEDGSNSEDAKAAMIAQCSDLSLKRTASPKSKKYTREELEAEVVAAGHSLDNKKVKTLIDSLMAKVGQ
jgi:hypothetical protein